MTKLGTSIRNLNIFSGQYGPRVFGACVASCGRRCPWIQRRHSIGDEELIAALQEIHFCLNTFKIFTCTKKKEFYKLIIHKLLLGLSEGKQKLKIKNRSKKVKYSDKLPKQEIVKMWCWQNLSELQPSLNTKKTSRRSGLPYFSTVLCTVIGCIHHINTLYIQLAPHVLHLEIYVNHLWWAVIF